jgi:hypothetical protein
LRNRFSKADRSRPGSAATTLSVGVRSVAPRVSTVPHDCWAISSTATGSVSSTTSPSSASVSASSMISVIRRVASSAFARNDATSSSSVSARATSTCAWTTEIGLRRS